MAKPEQDPDEAAEFDPLTNPAPQLSAKELSALRRKAYQQDYWKARKERLKAEKAGKPPGKPGRPPKSAQPAVPKNYEPVWSPLYKEDGTPGPQFAMLSCPFPEIFFGGARGGGKALPLVENVVTPTGYRKMGDLQVGDKVHGPDASIVTVIGVYPQGSEDVFQITLVDGRSVRASRGHLWRVRIGDDEMTVTTDYIRGLMESPIEVSLPVETLDQWVAIKSILYDGLAYTQCIKVDSADGLFLTNDEIITHNTDGAIGKWLQHASRYGENAKGVFFRRRFKQLEDVQARCSQIFSRINATYNKGDATWVFPNGAVLKLRHLWDIAATEEYHGHSYCVAKGTPILMGDGSYQAIETVRVGDLVMTLEGPKPVTATMPPRLSPCVRMEVFDSYGEKIGEQIHPEDHPVLTSVLPRTGSLPSTCPEDAPLPYSRAAQLDEGPHPSAGPDLSSRHTQTLPEIPNAPAPRTGSSGSSRTLPQRRKHPGAWQSYTTLLDAHRESLGYSACPGDDRTGYTASGDGRSEPPLRPRLSCPVVLHGPDPRSFPDDDAACDPPDRRTVPDWSGRCSTGVHPCDELLLLESETVPASSPSPNDAVSRTRPLFGRDDQDYIPEYTHPLASLDSYAHPYSGEPRRIRQKFHYGVAVLEPCEPHVVYDLTVSEANHYVTKNGVTNVNTFLCFEEVTNWPSPDAINRLRGTLRSSVGVQPELIMTGNPGGAGHCVPYGEVLTPSGWRDIKTISVGDSVMTVTQKGVLVEAKADQVHTSRHVGLMAAVSQGGVTIVCTPNHKVGVVSHPDRAKILLKQFDQLGSGFSIPRVLSQDGKDVPLDDSGRAEMHITADAVRMLDYEGDVYCIGVDKTHSFLIRQNGFVWVSGNSWVKARYISPAPQGWVPIKDEETGQYRIYIPSRLTDNSAMMKNDPTYAARLRGTGSASLVNAWLNGDWDIVAGGFFDDLIDPNRHFLQPFVIPAGWSYRRSFDWGSASPASLGVWAVSDGNPVPELGGFVFPRGSLIRVKEWYTVGKTKSGDIIPNTGLRLTNVALGEGIAQRSGGLRFSGCVADPSIYSKLGRESIYDEMRAGARQAGHNLVMSPADNNRIGGWQKMRDMLESSAQERPERPGLWVFETCHHWLRTVPIMQRSDTDYDDVDTTQEDHCADDTRYACMTGGRTLKIADLIGR
jgi:hypothetical protein